MKSVFIYPPIEKIYTIALKAEVEYINKIRNEFNLDELSLSKMLGVDRKTIYNKVKKYKALQEKNTIIK